MLPALLAPTLGDRPPLPEMVRELAHRADAGQRGPELPRLVLLRWEELVDATPLADAPYIVSRS